MARARKSASKTVPVKTARIREQPFDPATLNALLLEAVDHQREGRLERAAEIYASIQTRNPDDLNAPHLHAIVEAEMGLLVDAAARLRAVLRRKPDWPEAETSLAYVYSEMGLWREALEAYRRALALRPEDASIRIALAGALEVAGRLDEAIAIYRGLAEEPDQRLAGLIHIAQSRIADLSAEEIHDLAVAARDEATTPKQRIVLNSALGAMHERNGRYDEAFEAFALANRIRRDELISGKEAEPAKREMVAPESRVADLHPDLVVQNEVKRIRFIKEMFTADFLKRYRDAGSHIAAPIFIVGMPRSGSTLLEQILSSHRRVQGIGESAALSNTLEGVFPFDLMAANPPDHFRRLAEAYLKDIHARGWKSSPRFVDKTLPNFMDIGMMALMFPEAVIINSVRDPVDNCLAIFRQQLRGWSTTSDLRDIGEMYVRYRDVMDHWENVLPGRVVQVSHEAMVDDPDTRIRQLVTEVCGLPWDDACLRFYETQRPVRTASVAQVRQPIFKTSVERWRRYEKHLGALFEALGPYAPAERRGA